MRESKLSTSASDHWGPSFDATFVVLGDSHLKATVNNTSGLGRWISQDNGGFTSRHRGEKFKDHLTVLVLADHTTFVSKVSSGSFVVRQERLVGIW